mmetsp:Transcript_2763/g.4166  ORF Transcript_2763/g.4166 Transcript_2763/m.4166 type:complete len:892 (+) Transcript_2763:64-2739(+)
MYGWINACIKSLIISKFGTDKWHSIINKSKLNDDFHKEDYYNDESTYTLVSIAADLLGLTEETVLEEFGAYFVQYCRQEGYDNLLRCLGDTFHEWLSNINSLHNHLMVALPDMKAPQFWCEMETDRDDVVFLHYKSSRGASLYPIVVGMVREVASQYFYRTILEFELLQLQSVDHSHTSWRIVSTTIDGTSGDGPNGTLTVQNGNESGEHCPALSVDIQRCVTSPVRCPFSSGTAPAPHIVSSTSSDESTLKKRKNRSNSNPICIHPGECLTESSENETNTENTPLSINENQMKELFPFFVAFDSEFKIISHGKHLTEFIKTTIIGRHMQEVFEVRNPPNSYLWRDWNQVCSINYSQCEIALLPDEACRGVSLAVKGQVCITEDGRRCILLCVPNVRRLSDMFNSGINIRHLSKHDCRLDMVLQIEHLFSEADNRRRMASALDEQRQLTIQLMKETAEQAERTLAIKRTFVRYVSHEIRTPLTIAKLGLQLLDSEIGKLEGSADAVQSLQDCISSIDIAVSILNDLLSYEKLESGILELYRNFVVASSFFLQAVKPFYLQARQQDIALVVNIEDRDIEERYLDIDCSKVCQVIRNLVSNALKFTPAGGTVSLAIRTDDYMGDLMSEDTFEGLISEAEGSVPISEPTDPGYIRCGTLWLEVTDSGVGISEDNQCKIFNEIIQFSPNELQGGGGSGLGLWISNKIVKLHRGDVGMSSGGVGQGCTFYFRLPSYRRKEGEQDGNRPLSRSGSFHSRSTSPSPDYSCLRAKRVLVVDDSVLVRKLVVKVLTVHGAECTEAVDGAQAVDIVRNDLQKNDGMTSIDLILMDYIMPRMSGPEATRIIRTSLHYNGHIIGLTGNVMPSDVDIFLAAGASQILPKPLNVQSLAKYFDENR